MDFLDQLLQLYADREAKKILAADEKVFVNAKPVGYFDVSGNYHSNEVLLNTPQEVGCLGYEQL